MYIYNIYICMCIYIYICMYVCIYIYVYIYRNRYIIKTAITFSKYKSNFQDRNYKLLLFHVKFQISPLSN